MNALLTPILFDAFMRVEDVLSRAAANGYWLDAKHARPHAIERDVRKCGAAIRRQWGTYILWYARPLGEVLVRCATAPANTFLLDALGLHESNSNPAVELSEIATIPQGTLLLMESGVPVGVSLAGDVVAPLPPRDTTSRAMRSIDPRSTTRASPLPAATPKDDTPTPVTAWPSIDAPEWVRASVPFVVEIGFATEQRDDVAGGSITLPFTDAKHTLDVTIELSAGPHVTSQDGWSQTISVAMDAIEAARARFTLVGAEPADMDTPWLTTLEVRYVIGGTVCGVASRPLSILPASSKAGPDERPYGTKWSAMSVSDSPITLVEDRDAPDLTLEITKPDGNHAKGEFQCRLLSPHAIKTPSGPFDIDLGDDARTFARQLSDALHDGGAMGQMLLGGFENLVASRLPPEFFDALAEVSSLTHPAPPAVLIVTEEMYVPWELATVDPPLDPTRPNVLGAQAVVGKWMRDSMRSHGAKQRPPTHPVNTIKFDRLAVMAAWYRAQSGMKQLPQAEAEAKDLVAKFNGVPLAAETNQLIALLNANVKLGFDDVDVQAVHFAGHGNYDPTQPDASHLLLQDGSPVNSLAFRNAKYGGDHQPLLFLNACMLGIGADLLGDMAGFPGNSLRGGFGGVVGALWEVDDTEARRFATEFWTRALPSASPAGEPIGVILRDLRQKYESTPATPILTFLAYVYYGHPRLTLHR